MARKLVSMITEAKKAQSTGMARDLDVVAERLFRGKYVKGAFLNGNPVSGKVTGVSNGGFRGIEVHLITKAGERRTVSISTCRVWSDR